MRRVTWRPTQLALAAAACSLMLAVAVQAQRGGGAPAGPTLVPVAASSLLLRPDAFLGDTVSVYGAVEQSLTATAFSMDQDPKKPALNDLLVIAPTLNKQPAPGAYMTVVGVVIKFDPAEIQKRASSYKLDLPSTVSERYRGKVMVLATSVVDPELEDLAKVLPKPLTPEEKAFSEIMLQVNPAAAALRQGADASDKAAVTEQAATLAKLFGQVKTFFEARKADDAVGWATEGVALMNTIQKAVAANQWPDAQASAAKVTALCQSCHAAHRERQPDGTFRIKGQ